MSKMKLFDILAILLVVLLMKTTVNAGLFGNIQNILHTKNKSKHPTMASEKQENVTVPNTEENIKSLKYTTTEMQPMNNHHQVFSDEKINNQKTFTDQPLLNSADLKNLMLETTTADRSIIDSPIKLCPEGQRRNPDRVCKSIDSNPDKD